jgi:predicted TIM-barrel fold metal-dependent hydrolase
MFSLNKTLFGSVAAVLLLLAARASGEEHAAAPARVMALMPAASPYIDAHLHVDQNRPGESIQLVLQAMDHLNQARGFVLTEPYGPDNPNRWDVDKILAAVKRHPDKLIVLGGGGTLNGMIIASYRSGDSGPDVQRKFREQAEKLVRDGIAGFGEMSTEHFSLPQSPVKDYEYAPADHPLMLLLADIAAEHNIPIDLHMEAVPGDMASPENLKAPNPPRLHGNFAALERLLAHNPGARIIWAHAGQDNTGYRTPELMRPLLTRHPNLYMEIKYDPTALGKNPPVGADGKLKAEWLRLYRDFPDRFLIGSDQHYDPPSATPLARAQANAKLLDQLPPDLRRKIALDNPLRIYGLK